jgi:predicted MFS family arabinose efflux permease
VLPRPFNEPKPYVGQHMSSPPPSTGPISRPLVLLLAVSTGVAVATNYYAQPLLDTIGRSLHLASGEAGLVVTASQIGYAAGLVFLVPLADLVERRRLVVAMCLFSAAGLVGAAAAPNLAVLLALVAFAGATSVVAQMLVAFGATLAAENERGKVVGTVMSGLLLGVLLARTAAGYIAAASSWRVVYLCAAALMGVLALVLWRSLPRYRAELDLAYPKALASVVAIFRREPVLRRRSLYGGLSFAAFSILWTSLAFLLSSPPYHYGAGTIGLFGLAGVAGALMASVAGRFADAGQQQALTVLTAVAMTLAFVVLLLDPDRLLVLIGGIVLLDLGSQGLHITNQSEIYALAGEARNRVNSAYMTCYFTGGTLGSVGSAFIYGRFGWDGVASFGASVAGLAFVLSLGEGRFRRRQRASVAPAAL